MKKLLVLIQGLILLPFFLFGQRYEPSKTDLEMVLNKFINYRFGTVSIYKIKKNDDIKRAIKKQEEAAKGVQIDEALLKAVDQEILGVIERGAKGGKNLEAITTTIIEDLGKIPPDQPILESIFNFFKSKGEAGAGIENCYLITTRASENNIPNTIIALIVTTESEENIAKNLRGPSPANIYTYDELKAFKLDSTFTSDNLYDLMVNSLIQRNVENKTLEAQGIGNPEWFAPRKFGRSSSLISMENDAVSYDIQNFVRISEGQALGYGLKENEVIVSPDLLSWKRYDKPRYWDGMNSVVDSLGNSNVNLPKFGLELRYGIEDINYPSFWSERMSLSAIWESVKLGLILPTDGWASMGKDVYNIDRKLTYGGFGVTGSFDFPFKVIPKSGIFKFNFGYVFGDANESKYKNRKIDPNNYDPNLTLLFQDFDYLVRLNAQLHYTFAISVDEDYWFRFGVGGTIYNVERWYNDLDTSGDINKLKFRKFDDETVGGISGRIEFMAKNIITPFGAFVQYFDESMSAGLWLQIPIIEKTLALRLDAKGFFSAFKSQPHQWESKSVFVPSARLIINF
ncbi:MAG: hypothetical protein N2319_03060 [Candidatus Kapabacteria bacterium]|nr:hypothetical protein [Candidatus Kapabacteria bacterium]